MAFESLKGWTSQQKHVVTAAYLGWTMDAYDFFLMVFVFKYLAADFHTSIPSVALAVSLTLACRPIGAFIFGRLADRYGRRPILMVDIALYSVLSFGIAFTQNLTQFLILASAFGVAMGGVWGIGASLAFETIKPKARGFVSGLLQSGYPTGYLIASVIYGLLFPHIGWRGMFMVGIIPAAILVFYIGAQVKESPSFATTRTNPVSTWSIMRSHWKLALFAICLMTAYNFFSHGTQDLYPTFLQKQHGFNPATVSTIAIIYNIGAIIGGLTFGSISQSFGRRNTVVVAALLAIPVIYLWSFSTTAAMLALGAFLMQICVQGAWGVVPAHLNELSPAEARGTFPGTIYQLGNFIASANAVLQAGFAEKNGGNYSMALAVVAGCAALAIAVLMKFGPEAHNISMGVSDKDEAPPGVIAQVEAD